MRIDEIGEILSTLRSNDAGGAPRQVDGEALSEIVLEENASDVARINVVCCQLTDPAWKEIS